MADDGGHSRTETKTIKNDVLRAKKKAFLTRKECIKKKTMELSVLCDVKACTVIIGPDGQVETWPENRSDVREVINLYRNGSLNNKRKQQYDDRGCNKKQVLGGDKGAKNRALNPEEFLKKLEAKIDQVNKQIQFVKSKDQEIDSGCSFVKYDTSEETDKPDYSFSYQLGNPLCGGIPPNAWPPKYSQDLGLHSNVDMLGFGNQLHGLQSVTSFSTTQSSHVPYYAGHTPYSQAPQIQQLPDFSGQLTVPQPQMQHNAPSAPQQGPVMENILQIPAQPFQPLNHALSQFAQMLSQEKQTPQASKTNSTNQLSVTTTNLLSASTAAANGAAMELY
ncbi:unnamed protein product [Fraxinus pennsylvanica]|uniref:MADS-box domain-containing protein n=1 Tax=Fraxinus pennsylvanica TaxID=56036 RepID=A0AAD1ZID7_9LAMI|nr:unnamed protein product [Fraxinus pennsylvanica]